MDTFTLLRKYYTLTRYLPLHHLAFVLHLTEHIKHPKEWPVELISLRLSSKKMGISNVGTMHMTVCQISMSQMCFLRHGNHRRGPDEQSLVDGLKGLLHALPVQVCQRVADTEWRSDWKWSRVMSSKTIRDALEGASVLDCWLW